MVSTPLKNISQLGLLFPIYGKIKMFQTTNQYMLPWLLSSWICFFFIMMGVLGLTFPDTCVLGAMGFPRSKMMLSFPFWLVAFTWFMDNHFTEIMYMQPNTIWELSSCIWRMMFFFYSYKGKITKKNLLPKEENTAWNPAVEVSVSHAKIHQNYL